MLQRPVRSSKPPRQRRKQPNRYTEIAVHEEDWEQLRFLARQMGLSQADTMSRLLAERCRSMAIDPLNAAGELEPA